MLPSKPNYNKLFHLAILAAILLVNSCSLQQEQLVSDEGLTKCIRPEHYEYGTMNRALLATHFATMDELLDLVDIEYLGDSSSPEGIQSAIIKHCSRGYEINSVLSSGKDEGDFKNAKNGNIWDKLDIVFHAPYAVQNRSNLQQIFILARRKPDVFGQGDVAFYDLALACVNHIYDDDLLKFSTKDTTEKGYINTFNHITAQALVTSIYSEQTADFIADAHERHNMPELITGEFSSEQMADPENNPIDNYVDIINNEWGQEIGKKLSLKYNLHVTNWSPEMLAQYMNDLQHYYSWSFNIRMKPFREEDEVIQRFASKLNVVLNE